MNFVVGCDHGGIAVKEAVAEELIRLGHRVEDLGARSETAVDYPDFAVEVAERVVEGSAHFGVLVCRTGIGMSMVANRFAGVRAALCHTVESARLARTHNSANVLALSGSLPLADARAIAVAFAQTPSSEEARHQRRLRKLERAARLSEPAALAGGDPEVHAAVVAQIRQEESTINLIASENLVTRAVREASGSVFTNKYAEGYPGRRWYNGCVPADTVETLAIERARKLFKADHANVQPHCGSAANMAVYFSVLKPGDTILAMSLSHGGHLTHGSPVSFSGQLYNIVPYHVTRESETLDYDEIMRLARECGPRLIVAGASAYPRVLDFQRFREIADACGAMLMVDMAHIAGLVAGGAHPSPVPYAEFVTSTTHKTLRGPRGGLILCQERFAKDIDKTVFPGLQGGPLENIIAAKAVCFKEALSPEFGEYAAQVVANSQTLAHALLANGFRLVSGGTENHLMLVDVAQRGLTGHDCAIALDAAGIICNKNTIPFESNSPFVTSGIRLGTASVTTRGMREAEMIRIADWITETLDHIADSGRVSRIRAEVERLCADFPVP